MADRLTFGPQQQQYIQLKAKENLLDNQMHRTNARLSKRLKEYEQKCQKYSIKNNYQVVLTGRNKQTFKMKNNEDKQNNKQLDIHYIHPQKKIKDASTQAGTSICSKVLSNECNQNSQLKLNQFISSFSIKSKDESDDQSSQRKNDSLVEKKYSFGKIETKFNKYQINSTAPQQSCSYHKPQPKNYYLRQPDPKIYQIKKQNYASPFSLTNDIRQAKSILTQNSNQNSSLTIKNIDNNILQNHVFALNRTDTFKKKLVPGNIYTNLNYSHERSNTSKSIYNQQRVDNFKINQRSNYQVKKQSFCDKQDSLSKLGSKINRITDRIRRSEENKKKLQIQYKPFSYNKRKSEQFTATKAEFNQVKFNKIREVQTLVQDCTVKISQRQLNFIKKEGGHNNPLNQQCFKKKKQKHAVKIQQNINKIEETFHDKQFSFHYEKIQMNRQNKSDYDSSRYPQCLSKYFTEQKNELDKLICALKRQIKLDEELRITKTWFVHSKIDFGDKFEQLKKIIIDKDYDKNYPDLFTQPLTQIFHTPVQQQNPFVSSMQHKIEDKNRFYLKAGNLIENYIASQTNWIANIQNQMDSDKLINQGFNKRMLDIQNIGRISLQDLVTFMNTHTGIFYRVKDLFLIYKRILRYVRGINADLQYQSKKNSIKETGLLFEEILDCLCLKNS